MQKKQIIPTHQIIFFVVFVSAALITSLFIFHLRHQENPILSPDKGMIFPAAREIKSFELIADNQEKFKIQNFYHHWTLLFFGFTHCENVCPMTLEVMKKAYLQLHAKYPTLQVVLVSVDANRDSPAALSHYMHTFHPDFIGVTGKQQEIRQLQSQLGVFSAQNSGSSSDYQIQHTASIMLINPQGKWAGFFRFGLKPNELTQAVKQSVDFLGPVST